MTNLYYNPAALDLEIIEQNDIAGSYEFDMAVIWRHNPTGRMFYAFDSGCSCPCPFENHWFEVKENGTINTNLEEITRANWEGAAQELCKNHFELSKITRMLSEKFK